MKTSLKVPSISCAHCKSTIEGAVDQLGGVAHVAVDIDGQNVEIEFDPEQVSIEAIKKALDDVGYEVVG